MKKFASLFTLSVFCTAAFAQSALFNNNGADIYVKDGGFMIVKTNSVNNALSGGQGKIDNQGTIVVEGDVKNGATITGNGDTIKLQGNWINNNAYTGSNSWVDMNGSAQKISGTAVTTFDNLNLGGGAAVKTQTINAVTSGVFQLNDAELATDVYEMLVSNNATTAITRNNGFVSSIGAGRLSRATNAASSYIFPTGSPSSSNGPSIFRPVEMTPASASANVYSATLVKGDATGDGYNVHVMDDSLCAINPNFYHRLYHASGADAADLAMYFDPNADGNWTEESHWKPSRWNYIGTSAAGNNLGFSTVTVGGVSDFTPEPFALARKRFALNAGPDVAISEGQSTVFNPVIGASGTTTVLWTPADDLTCTDCVGPTASPITTTQYVLTVTDAAGCQVSDSLLVKINESVLLIPSAFSPNGDGVNELFRVLNKNLSKVDLQVYNRWGEKVYETTDITEGWDGTFKNMKQGTGVYIWECTYTLIGETRSKAAKGNVTLLR